MTRYWVSWWTGNYADEGCTTPPFKYWLSGQKDRAVEVLDESGEPKDDCSICAVIDAENEDTVWELVSNHFPDYSERFCEEQTADFIPGDRFQ